MTYSDPREDIQQPGRPKFGSFHQGVKSKEVLEQELFSLKNQTPPEWKPDHKEWEMEYIRVLAEYNLRFPGSKWEEEWFKWAKAPRK